MEHEMETTIIIRVIWGLKLGTKAGLKASHSLSCQIQKLDGSASTERDNHASKGLVLMAFHVLYNQKTRT